MIAAAALVGVLLATAKSSTAQPSCGTSDAEDMTAIQLKFGNQDQDMWASRTTKRDLAMVTPQTLVLPSGHEIVLTSAVPSFQEGNFFMALLFDAKRLKNGGLEAIKKAGIHCSDQEGKNRVPAQMFVPDRKPPWTLALHCPWPQAEAKKGAYDILLDSAHGQKIGTVHAAYKPGLLRRYGTTACINNVWNGVEPTLKLVPPWMEFQLLHGVDHFLVYTQHGTDVSVLDLYEPYIKAGLATRVHFNVSAKLSTGYQTQPWMANDCLYRAKGHTRWLMPTVDADEYFRLGQNDTKGDYLRTFWDQMAKEELVRKNMSVYAITAPRIIFERKINPKDLDHLDISTAYRYPSSCNLPKFVCRPDMVNTTWIHWPSSFMPEGFENYQLDMERGFFAHYRDSPTQPTMAKTKKTGRKPDVLDETLLADIPAVHMALERRFRKPWAEVAAKFTKGSDEAILAAS